MRGGADILKRGLVVIETHPIQYHAPVYRNVQQRFGIPVTVIYGSDFSVVGYWDPEFQAQFAWDTDLLSGYEPKFLSRVSEAGARSVEKVSARGLGEVLRQTEPRAVLLMGYSPRFHQRAFYETWERGYPILFRGETADHTRDRGPFRSWVRDRILCRLYRRCARLLYVGQSSYQHFRRLGCPEEKLIFSPYCVDTASFECDEAARARLRPSIRQKLELTENHKVLLFSGKLSWRKGVDLILPAVRKMPLSVQKEIVVLFMGDGELKETLENQEGTPTPLPVRFLGFQNQSTLSSYYHAADLLILPSRHSETWGLVVNEALHHGVPCVVSEGVGCAPDLVEPGRTGEICFIGEVQSLATTLERALKLIGRREIRESCRQKVSGYTVEKAADGIARGYQSLWEESAGK